jgi:hypothetical protein
MQAFKAVALFGMSVATAQEEDLTAGSITVRILGQSGKLRMFSTTAGTNDTNVVTIEMDALRELDIDGNPVGSSGPEKHSIQTFANQDFVFNPIESVMIGVNESVSARKISFQSSVGDVGSMSVDTFIMSSPGLVGPEGEEWGVGVGDMKFNINFPNWNWCGDAESNCQRADDVGAFLELDIKIKGASSEVTLIDALSRTYDLGGDANLTLTNKVMLDDVQSEMPAGFPSLRQQGSSQIFTFRFPRFTTSAQYDPLLRQGWHWGQLQQAWNNIDTAQISGSFPQSSLSVLTCLAMLTGVVFSL